MNVRIRLPLALLESHVNQVVGSRLMQAGQSGDGKGVLFAEVKQIAPVMLESGQEEIVSSVAVEVKALVNIGDPSLFELLREVSGFEELSFELSVKMHTHIEVGNNWLLKSKSRVSYEWLRKPRVGFSLLKLNIGRIIQPFLENELEEVAKEIDAKIVEEVNLQELVRSSWREIHLVRKVEENFPVWLTLLPEEAIVKLMPLEWKNTNLEIRIMVPLQIKAYLLDQAVAPAYSNQVPLQDVVKHVPDTSTFTLQSFIAYRTLGNYLIHKPLEDQKGKVSFTLSKAILSGRDSKLQGQFEFNGEIHYLLGKKKIRGVCFLEGELKIDETRQSVYWQIDICRFRDLGFFDRMMSKVYSQKIRRELQAGIRSALDQQLSQTEKRIATELAEVQLNSLIVLRSKLYRFIPSGINLKPQGIAIDFEMKTSITLEVIRLEAV